MILNLLVPSDKDGSESIYLTMGSFDDPTPSAFSTFAIRLLLLSSRTNVWDVIVDVLDHAANPGRVITFIHA